MKKWQHLFSQPKYIIAYLRVIYIGYALVSQPKRNTYSHTLAVNNKTIIIEWPAIKKLSRPTEPIEQNQSSVMSTCFWVYGLGTRKYHNSTQVCVPHTRRVLNRFFFLEKKSQCLAHKNEKSVQHTKMKSRFSTQKWKVGSAHMKIFILIIISIYDTINYSIG